MLKALLKRAPSSAYVSPYQVKHPTNYPPDHPAVSSARAPTPSAYPLPARRTSFPLKGNNPISNIHHTSVFLPESQNSRNTKRHFAYGEKTFVRLRGFVLLDKYLLLFKLYWKNTYFQTDDRKKLNL